MIARQWLTRALTRPLAALGLFPHVELIHRRGDVAVEEQFEGIDGSLEAGGIDRPLFS